MSSYSGDKYSGDPNTSWYKIMSMIKPGSKVLDVGCSSGNLGKELKKIKNCIVTGVEIDNVDAMTASQVLDEVFHTNFETKTIPKKLLSQKFDYLIFADVIEHLVDPINTLRKVKTLLKEEGQVLFSIPNMAHMSVRLMLLEGRFEYGETGLLDKTHLHFYDKNEIKRVFFEAGYMFKIFGWTSRDYPKELLRKKIKNMGLDPSESFLSVRNKPEAAAYQFVGSAIPGNKKPRELKTTSPSINDIEKYIENTQKNINEIAETLKRENKNLKDGFTKLSKTNQHLVDQINAIESSRSFKVAQQLSKVKKLCKRDVDK